MRITTHHYEPLQPFNGDILLESIGRISKGLLGTMGNIRQGMGSLLSPEGEAVARGQDPNQAANAANAKGVGTGGDATKFSRANVTMILAQTQAGLHNPAAGDLEIRNQRLYYHKDPRNFSRLTFATDQNHWIAFEVVGIGHFAPDLKQDYQIKLLAPPTLNPRLSPNVEWVRIENMTTVRSAL